MKTPISRLRLLGWALLLAALVASFWFAPLLPPTVAIHWGIDGQANGWAPAWVALLMLPAFMLLIALAWPWFLTLKGMGPRENKPLTALRPYWEQFGLVLLGFFLYLHLLSLGANLGWPVPFLGALAVGLGFLFFALGRLLPHLPPNWLMGVRTPWTLRDDQVWKAVHARAGPMFHLCGLLALAALLWPGLAMLWMIGPILVTAVYLAVYSYQQYAGRHSR